jgi:hypothetical protein
MKLKLMGALLALGLLSGQAQAAVFEIPLDTRPPHLISKVQLESLCPWGLRSGLIFERFERV